MKIANWSKEIIIVPGLKLQKDDDLLSLLRGYTLEHTQYCKYYCNNSRVVFLSDFFFLSNLKSRYMFFCGPQNRVSKDLLLYSVMLG